MAVFLCYNVQTIDFCVSVTNQAEWGALWLYNAARGMKCDVNLYNCVMGLLYKSVISYSSIILTHL